MNHDKFVAALTKAKTEEDVIATYQRLLPGDWRRPFGSDGLEHETLFEFKHDIKMEARDGFKVMAQGCYYLRLIWRKGVYKGEKYTLPLRLAVCDRNEAAVISVQELLPLFSSDDYDWSRPASSPDPKLVSAVKELVKRPVVFRMSAAEQVAAFRDALKHVGTQVRCEITRHNFLQIFTVWRELFSDASPQDVAMAFVVDLTGTNMFLDAGQGQVIFRQEGHMVNLTVQVERYQKFWLAYRRPPNSEEMRAIIERKDQLVAIQHRRMTGEFFTPLDIAELAHQYLYTADDQIYDRPFWDMAAGTGNLTFHVPRHTRLFISTLHKQDLETIKSSGQNPVATLFQFDFLNDPWEKLPAGMIERIKQDGELVVMINPPFAAGTGGTKDHKEAVSSTATAKMMDGLSHAVQNTYTQFMFRLLDLAKTFNVEITLGIFSKATWGAGPGYAAFRDLWCARAKLLGGFDFVSAEFADAKGKWPVAFSMWKISP